MFNEEYFHTLNYTDYFEREERYVKLAQETTEILEKLNLMKEPILDFGCAVGFLIKGLEKCGYKDCDGYDISEWAVKYAKSKGINVSNEFPKRKYNIGYFLDVLEHIPEDDLKEIFSKIHCKVFIFRMPVVKKEGENYVLEASRRDLTHIIRWTKQQWEGFFKYHNYAIISLNLHTVYDSPGVFCGLCIKDDSKRFDNKM